MSGNISYDYETIKDLLVGDYGSEEELWIMLNVLKHVTSIIGHLHLAECVKNQCNAEQQITQNISEKLI